MPPRQTKRPQPEVDPTKAAAAEPSASNKVPRVSEQSEQPVADAVDDVVEDSGDDSDDRPLLQQPRPLFTATDAGGSVDAQSGRLRTPSTPLSLLPVTPLSSQSTSTATPSTPTTSSTVELFLCTSAGPTTAGGATSADGVAPSRLMSAITSDTGNWAVGVIIAPNVPRNSFLGMVNITPLLSSTIQNYAGGHNAFGTYMAVTNVEKLPPPVPGFALKNFGPMRIQAFRATNNSRATFRETKDLPTFMPPANGIRHAVKDSNNWVLPVTAPTRLQAAEPRSYIVLAWKEFQAGMMHKFEAKMLCKDGEWGDVDLVLNTARSSFAYPSHMDTALRNAVINADLLVLSGKHPHPQKGYKASVYIDAAVVTRLDKAHKQYAAWKAAAKAPPPVVDGDAMDATPDTAPVSPRVSHWRTVASGAMSDAASLKDGVYARVRLHPLAIDDPQLDGAPVMAFNFTRNGRWHAAFIRDGGVLTKIPGVADAVGSVAQLNEYIMPLLLEKLQEPFVADIGVRAEGPLLEIADLKCVKLSPAEEDAVQFDC